MKGYVSSLLPRIEANYHNFTNLEKTIADFFLNNTEKTDFSAKAISGKLFVSEASLSRFAKKIGYRGYREFRINQRIIAGNAQFTGIAAGQGVGFTTGLLHLRKGLGMRETPIRPHS